MDVNREVEAHLREAFSAVVGRDRDRLFDALRPLDHTGSEHALHLALFVCAFIVRDVHRDGPTPENLQTLAEQVARSESEWTPVEPAQVAELLRVAVDGDTTLGALDRADVAALAVICAGHLLAAFRMDDQTWWQYLDEILEAALEA